MAEDSKEKSPCDIIVERLLEAKNVYVFTGAGVSAESGIATYRESLQGLWSAFDPMELASPTGWKKNKARVWAWYESRRAKVMLAEPNAGHYGIAQLQDALRARTGGDVVVDVVTQNVDDLHERGAV